MLKPYTDNIIFFDSEFSSLNPYLGEILSVGMVKINGEEFYAELEYEGKCSGWVKENILPSLTGRKIPRRKAAKMMKKFIGKNKPFMIAYVNQFDAIYSHKLFLKTGWPFHKFTMDFASMLFSYGYDPREMIKKNSSLLRRISVDPNQYDRHHALSDAKMLRDVYLKLLHQTNSSAIS